MTRGPKPTPTNLVAFTGGKAATLAKVAERERNGAVEPEISIPKAPDDMSVAGQLIWSETATKLAKMRVMSEADTAALEIYVNSWLRYKNASAKVDATGLLIVAPSGYPIQNPMLAIANKAQEQCLKILVEFGLTPSSRTRVNRE